MRTTSHPQSISLKRDAGYTLIEVLIAMQLGILVFGFALWGFGLTTKMLASWKKKTRKNVEQLRAEQALRTALDRLHFITEASDTLLAGQSAGLNSVILKWTSSSTFLNNKKIVSISSLNTQYHLCIDNQIIQVDNVPEKWLRFLAAIEITWSSDEKDVSAKRFFARIRWGQNRSYRAKSRSGFR